MMSKMVALDPDTFDALKSFQAEESKRAGYPVTIKDLATDAINSYINGGAGKSRALLGHKDTIIMALNDRLAKYEGPQPEAYCGDDDERI